MVAKAKSFIRYFTDVDVFDVRLELNGKDVVAFKINYRAFIVGAWREVVRYDNAHGKPLHVHRFWPPTKGRKRFLEEEIRIDYTDAVKESLADLEEHWQDYRRQAEHFANEGGI